MKRDIDLTRKILFIIEENNSFYTGVSIPGYDSLLIYHHLAIMRDAGLIYVRVDNPDYPIDENINAVRLTWEGHEFLEAVRDDKRWEKVKVEMAKSGGFVFEIAKSVALDFVEEEINPNRVQSLKSQLIRRYNNLNELEEQAANYGAAVVPLELKNQIKAEREAIAELEEKLKILTG